MPTPSPAVPATTRVGFPSGATSDTSTIVAAHPLGEGRLGVVTAATPFHPLDHTWPDQPGDTGTLTLPADGRELPVVDCLTGALGPAPAGTAADASGVPGAPGAPGLLIGPDIPVRRGEEGWAWLVVHVVTAPAGDPAALPEPSALLGAEALLRVDTARRAALSAAHTGCHLLALALNEALVPRWRKEARADAFGHPDFDGLAMDTSRMGVEASTDVYRIGKSLRKKGFTADGLAEELPKIQDAVNERLAGWLAADAPVRVETDGPELTARRRWVCELPEGTASLFCGGTHLTRLGELAALTTELQLGADGTELTAVTTPVLRG
ncbi:metal-dependent hydrolase [Allostreptomyces psammosilenae]|uniref:Alanyl-tRNA synthetase n=1 Tax=Allostreptomyces psammosilenae TaxID=1892865 RepID=A0A852ZVJ6_9ACTN|nr:metal-dependent hydrolase [Allostreptomyces psammosilenae]NYI05270.1 alanyl-tRNA synthetase [Allostreptomyces psammosilenae]